MLLRKLPLNLEDKIQKALIEKDYSKFQAEISNNGFLKYLPEFSTTYFKIMPLRKTFENLGRYYKNPSFEISAWNLE